MHHVVLHGVIQAVPLAIFGVVAKVTGTTGFGVFRHLGSLVMVVTAGLLIHALVYYTFIAWIAGRRTPREFLGALETLSFSSSTRSVTGRDAMLMPVPNAATWASRAAVRKQVRREGGILQAEHLAEALILQLRRDEGGSDSDTCPRTCTDGCQRRWSTGIRS